MRLNTRPCFRPAQIEAICKVLAHTDTGLTGAEIGRLLAQTGVRDIEPTITKWKRLYNALTKRQSQQGSGDRILAFIRAAMDPARYQGNLVLFETRRSEINVALALYGMEFGADGKFHNRTRASTLHEAEARAGRLRAALELRAIHPDVIMHCRAELVANDCFHAVLEATKSVAAKIRKRTGLASDGAELVDEALGGKAPLLRINAFATDTEKGEQRGFANLAKGLFGTFRNPTAHAPRIEWPLTEDDALDLMSLASYIHRRIDAAICP